MSTTENPQGRTPEDLEALIRRLQKENDRLKSEKNRVGISFRRVPESGAQIKALYDERFPYFEHVPEHSYTLADRHIDEEEDGKELSQPTDGNTTLIEAENLAALSALQLTHQGKVDVIYIDPPYNTGNKDFVYNDARTSTIEDAVDEEGNPLSVEDYEKTLDGNVRSVGKDNPERHSLWLSFMEKRLWLAKHLLSDEGVIFVSIDDNEQARLKLLMDEVFGEQNFVDTIMVELSGTQGMKVKAAQSGRIVKNGEYVVMYAKNAEKIYSAKRTPLYDEVVGYDSHFSQYFSPDTLELVPLSKHLGEMDIFKDLFKGKNSSTSRIGNIINTNEALKSYLYNEIPSLIVRQMMISLKIPYEIERKLSANKVTLYTPNEGGKTYHLVKNSKGTICQLLSLQETLHMTDDLTPRYGRAVIRGDFWKKFYLDMMNISKEGDIEFLNGKKPVRLVKQLCKWAVMANPNALILDFFAGSGTTAHAVAELNKEDGGNRQCILVTHGDENGKNIAEDVTAQRMKRVLSGKNWADGKEHESLPGELNYYRLQFAEKVLSNYHAADVMRDKFLGYVALEQDVVLSKDQLDEEGFYMLSSSRKNVAVVSDDFLLMDGSLDELMSEAYVEGKENLIYLPLADDTDINEYVPEGWTPIGFPVSYMDSYKSLISLMKSNKTLLQPVSESE